MPLSAERLRLVFARVAFLWRFIGTLGNVQLALASDRNYGTLPLSISYHKDCLSLDRAANVVLLRDCPDFVGVSKNVTDRDYSSIAR